MQTPALDRRIAVITGSASGIGRATAELFASHGATVVAVDRDAAQNGELVNKLRSRGASAEALTVDLGDRTALLSAAGELRSRHPVIDVLFNNAGAYEQTSFQDAADEHWDRILAVNLAGAFVLTRELLPALRRSRAASVINNASVDGLHGHPAAPAYSVAKGGLLTMTRALAYDFGGEGIRINSIAPGGIATPMVDAIPPRIREEVARITPLRRLGTPAEVAQVALFLASDASSFITGEAIVVDGGRSSITAGVLGPPPQEATLARH
jgi:NAD(P)-dependent dehydrogenase (short-subunit alcohol dehydrogenase family)